MANNARGHYSSMVENEVQTYVHITLEKKPPGLERWLSG